MRLTEATCHQTLTRASKPCQCSSCCCSIIISISHLLMRNDPSFNIRQYRRKVFSGEKEARKYPLTHLVLISWVERNLEHFRVARTEVSHIAERKFDAFEQGRLTSIAAALPLQDRLVFLTSLKLGTVTQHCHPTEGNPGWWALVIGGRCKWIT